MVGCGASVGGSRQPVSRDASHGMHSVRQLHLLNKSATTGDDGRAHGCRPPSRARAHPCARRFVRSLQFYKSSTMQVLVYATYGPLDIMCVLLIVLEVKFTVMPLMSAWINLNQRIEVISIGKKAADTAAAAASMPDWCEVKQEAADGFPGVLPSRRVPYEQLRDENERRTSASRAVERQRAEHAAASAARTADDDGDAAAAQRSSVRLDAAGTASPPSQQAQPHSAAGRLDRPDAARCALQSTAAAQPKPRQQSDGSAAAIGQSNNGSTDETPLCGQSSQA